MQAPSAHNLSSHSLLRPISLRFRDHSLEEPFQDAYITSNLTHVRLVVLLGLFYYSLFSLVDILVMPDKLIQVWTWRFGVMLPAALLVLLLSYQALFQYYWRQAIACLFLLSGIGLIYMTTLLPESDAYLYYAGIMLVYLFGYGFARLDFITASTVGLLIGLAFELVELLVNQPSSKALLANHFFIIGANMVGMAVCYHQERSARLAFFLQKQLAMQNAQLLTQNAKLTRLSAIDGLTGVANRRQFDQVLYDNWRQAREQQQPLALILGDIDHFKQYNDLYGHLAGDQCLIDIASHLEKNVSEQALVARYGGEEFAVILPMTDTLQAVDQAERLRQQIEQLRIPHRQGLAEQVTMSLGVCSLIPRQQDNLRDFIQCVDSALYDAKLSGRNKVKVGDLMQ